MQQLETRRAKEYVRQLQVSASEIVESQREITESKPMVEEAERSLFNSMSKSGDRDMPRDDAVINQDAERLKSTKVAFVSTIVGTAAALPISFTQVSTTSQFVLPLSVTFISCVPFRVTFRYAVRNLDNIQLKTGTSAAFGFVRGLGYFDIRSEISESFWSYSLDSALYISESLLMFTFAAVELDFSFIMGILSPFPIISKAKDADRRLP